MRTPKLLVMVAKDLKIEFRKMETLGTMLVFALLVITMFGFSFSASRQALERLLPGVLWMGLLFAGMLGLGRSFSSEMINGNIYGLMSCPVEWSTIYLSKLVSNFILVAVMELVAVPLLFVFFGIEFPEAAAGLVLVLVLGAIGFTAMGTFVSGLSCYSGSRELLMPVLMLPLSVPVVIASVQATQLVMDGAALGSAELMKWLQILGVYDAVAVGAAYLLFDYVLES